MTNLLVGLIGANAAWQGLLEQQGVCFAVQDAGDNAAPVWIVHKQSSITAEEITAFCRADGQVLMESSVWARMFSQQLHQCRVKWMIPQNDTLFGDVSLLDIYAAIAAPRRGTTQLDAGLHIHRQEIGAGGITIIPWDLDALLQRYDLQRKKVWVPRRELPSERLCAVDKAMLRRILMRLLEDLLHRKNLPFVHRWFYPANARSVFCFRLDTDFCSADDAEDMVALLRRHHLSATWVVDTQDEARLKETYAQFTDQEIGLHCHSHVVFDDVPRNRLNITRGVEALQRAGLQPRGFAAPFGEWNPALDAVLREQGFDYSGEFGLGYDDFPFYPLLPDGPSSVLQVPIHPISLGRLRRSHFTTQEMTDYFLAVMQRNFALHLPQIFYHHPHHGRLEVFDALFAKVTESGIPTMNLGQWTDWWKARLQAEVTVTLHGNKLSYSSSHPGLWLRVTTPQGEALLPAGEHILSSLPLASRPTPQRPEDIQRTRKWHWRDALYDYESRKGKRYHEDLFS